ncbi:hypothetical protein [Mesorhizobium sp. B2-3-5]|uniref:spike base protein, RCAP_Rcc01079 family n=1 Tax=Mesorhizobium sp. B2-3-5 TaxID=2589958 RepID=UPI001127999B|nr:hypothetical protein [Mesorhizobium sp. B2-3-5]TPM36630.1 hypothetical protein FJ958_02055 [Mesorhizobium sp. B2-3-5]
MFDPYEDNQPGPGSLGRSGRLVVPSNTTDLPVLAKALCVGTAGNVSVIPALNADADVIAFVGAPVGFVVPFQVRRVMATGTTATVYTVED